MPGRLRAAAVLVGTATHMVPSTLPSLPSAAESVAALHDALTGPFGLFDASAAHRRVDPAVAADVLDLFPSPGTRPLDLCLFYFAGHGVLGNGERLCLALPGTVESAGGVTERTSLPADAVFQAMRQVPARHKVAVLDCCFSARALDAPAAADIHVLAAAGRTKKAKTPAGSRVTGFTTGLLRVLADGVPEGPEHLDLTTLYRRLAVTLPAAGLPEPQQRAFGTTGDLAIGRNPAHGTATTREGLLARAWFAEQVRALGERGLPLRSGQAVRFFASAARDAAAALGPADPDTLRIRHAHAGAVGDAGDPGLAAALLDAVVADHAGADTPAARDARASRDHWLSRTPPPGPTA